MKVVSTRKSTSSRDRVHLGFTVAKHTKKEDALHQGHRFGSGFVSQIRFLFLEDVEKERGSSSMCGCFVPNLTKISQRVQRYRGKHKHCQHEGEIEEPAGCAADDNCFFLSMRNSRFVHV